MLIYFNKHYKRSYFLLTLPIKIAVHIIAIFTLIQHSFDEWKHWIRPVQKKQNTYLYIGAKEHFHNLSALAEQWGLRIEFMEGDETSLPEGHLADHAGTGKYRYIVYDTELFSMADILDFFQRSQKPLIGTYYPKRNILITNEKTYTL